MNEIVLYVIININLYQIMIFLTLSIQYLKKMEIIPHTKHIGKIGEKNRDENTNYNALAYSSSILNTGYSNLLFWELLSMTSLILCSWTETKIFM